MPASFPDEPAIGQLLQQLYEVISFEEDGEPDWPGLERVFSRHARITRITPEGTDYLDRESFLAMTRNLLDIGAYTSFFELEIARVVERFGDMAHVWSVYETRRNRQAREPLGRGVNSIQLVREGEAWRVIALLWDETHADPQLDAKTVFARGESRGQN